MITATVNIETGGPAFPGSGPSYPQPSGMTLRDYFAAKVIKECVNVCATNTSAAKEAYKIADAMLEARK